MSFSCVLCNGNHEEYLFTSKFCSKCKKIKNYITLIYSLNNTALTKPLVDETFTSNIFG